MIPLDKAETRMGVVGLVFVGIAWGALVAVPLILLVAGALVAVGIVP